MISSAELYNETYNSYFNKIHVHSGIVLFGMVQLNIQCVVPLDSPDIKPCKFMYSEQIVHEDNYGLLSSLYFFPCVKVFNNTFLFMVLVALKME